MKCSACGCPGAYLLLTGALCWNRRCRNFHQDVVQGSDWSPDLRRVNGDLVDDVKSFINDVGEQIPDELED